MLESRISQNAPISQKKALPILVLRYAIHRFYDTHNRCYISLDQLRERSSRGIALSVVDAESAKDVTATLLA